MVMKPKQIKESLLLLFSFTVYFLSYSLKILEVGGFLCWNKIYKQGRAKCPFSVGLTTEYNYAEIHH